ncbi:SRPBCC family protein [Candidatus Parcubacteria bacterium]|nr:SRPBCC family protein [Candidatus Parcubacteria bacterium]
MNTETITVETRIRAPIEKIWRDYTSPEAIKVWNAASNDWHTTRAENDLRVGGRFLSRMEAKDGSAGFDFTGTYDVVVPNERIGYTMEDGRKAEITFTPDGDGVHVIVTFDPETENTHEVQRAGWQAILDTFKKYSEKSR